MSGAHSLTVATYNVHRCVGTDGRKDPARVAKALRRLDADIIALQEVESRLQGRPYEDQAAYLAEELNTDLIRGPTIRSDKEHYGNALLVAHDVHAVEHHDISLPGQEPRGAIEADIAVSGGERVTIVATHLGLRFWERRAQADLLEEIVRVERSGPLILAGDFNVWVPWVGVYRRFDRLMGRSESLRTYPAWLPVLALDRIWVRPTDVVAETWVQRWEEVTHASDHLAVVARLNL